MSKPSTEKILRDGLFLDFGSVCGTLLHLGAELVTRVRRVFVGDFSGVGRRRKLDYHQRGRSESISEQKTQGEGDYEIGEVDAREDHYMDAAAAQRINVTLLC